MFISSYGQRYIATAQRIAGPWLTTKSGNAVLDQLHNTCK